MGFMPLRASYSAILEKEMATHSSTIAWKIPRTEEPSRGPPFESMGSSRTRLTDFISLHSAIYVHSGKRF